MRDILERISKREKFDFAEQDLRELVEALRPKKPSAYKEAEQNFYALIAFLKAYPEFRQGISQCFEQIFEQYSPLSLYTESGILPDTGFFSETFSRLGQKLLPALPKEGELRSLLKKVFYKSSDYLWVQSLPYSIFQEFFQALGLAEGLAKVGEQGDISPSFHQLINALLILSHRITAIGLMPDLVDKLPGIKELQSPFFSLNRELGIYIEKLRLDPRRIYNEEEEDYRHILVMLEQCRESIEYIYRNKDKYGVSLRLTYILMRLEQHLKRLEILLFLVEKEQKQLWGEKLVYLFKRFVRSENQRHSLRRHLSSHLALLTAKVVDHTSHTGQHYAARNKAEYNTIYKAALGGGAVVALLVCIKSIIAQWHIAPFGEGFLFSLNYALGFVLIYVLHYSLATKQPAMTASALAASIATDQKNRKNKGHSSESIQLVKQIVRTQFISLWGNVLLSFPVAYILAGAYYVLAGEHLVGEEKALKMAKELHLWQSGSLFFAALTGFYLMFSGLVAGYYDNLAVFRRIPERLRAHPLLQRIFSQHRLNIMSDYVGKKLGGLASNIALGILLGSTASLGIIFGLPLDIRHVTFGAGGLAVAVVGTGHSLGLELFLWAALGVVGIGFVNVFVSFNLTLMLALRARSVSRKQMFALYGRLFREFRLRPRGFFLPTETVEEKEGQDEMPEVAKAVARALIADSRELFDDESSALLFEEEAKPAPPSLQISERASSLEEEAEKKDDTEKD